MTQAQQIAAALEGYRTDSIGFVRHYFGATPDEWQAEALRAVDAGENVAIRSGHGVGKTTLLAWVAIQTTSCFPFTRVPCTAPTQHQLSDLLWAEIALWLNGSPLKHLLKWTATRLSAVGYEDSWFAVARASNKPENLAGFHAKKLRYIVDEGSGVANNIMEVVDGACTTADAQIIMAGNPTQRAGYFYDAFHKSRSQWHNIHISSEDSPRVSREYCETMAAKWGRDTDVYRVRVLGDFPLAEATGFISLDLVEAAVTRWHDGGYDDGPCEIGLDVARYGDDETCFAVRKGGRVLLLEPHRGWSTTQTSGRAIQLIREYNADSIKVDDTGVGGGVVDMLVDSAPAECEVVPCNFGGAGNDDYDNASTIWHANLKDLLLAGQLALPDDDDLVAQLTTRRYGLTTKGKIIIESKKDMKRPPRNLPSPDRAEAVALAFAQSGMGSGPFLTAANKREAMRY